MNILRRPPRALEKAPSRSGYSSSAGSPERTVDDMEESEFYTNDAANDSQTSIVDDEQLSGFRGMSVSHHSPAYLPPELLFAIFGRLISPQDLRSCLFVCKSWARCAVELLWLRPHVTENSLLSLVQTIQKDKGMFPYAFLIKRLNLTFLYEHLNDGTMIPLSVCTRLERLTLTNCSSVTDIGLVGVLANNPRLLALDLTGLGEITDRSMNAISQNCKRLQGLNITQCSKVTDMSMVQVAESCMHLKRLKLNDCDQLTDDSVIAFTTHCPNLLEIDLHKVNKITDKSVVEVFKKLRYLRELRLAHCDMLEDTAFTGIPRKTYDCLRILDLTNCEKITDDSVESIVAIAPRLRNLVLAKCRLITDRAVNHITKLGKNLHYLHLGHCVLLSDRAILNLIRSCNRIRYIDLACCSRLSDNSICQLSTLPKLRRIGLVKCQQITDRSILSLVHSNKTQPCALERVHLSYCANLTVHGIHELVNSCTRLTHLSLTGVSCFLRKDLTRFCRPPPADFNEHQRNVFCVFSGPGVAKLRNHLNDISRLGPSSEQVFYDADEGNDNGEVEEDEEDEEEETQEE